MVKNYRAIAFYEDDILIRQVYEGSYDYIINAIRLDSSISQISPLVKMFNSNGKMIKLGYF